MTAVEIAGAVSLIGFAVWLTAFLAVIALGFAVVMSHPDKEDPERNASRFTRPAIVGVLVALGGFAVGIAAGVVWIVGTLNS